MAEVDVFIEIQRHTAIKYEWDKITNRMCVDRIMPYPFFYPCAYGFVPNTLSTDGDEIDVLLITTREYPNNIIVRGVIVGGLDMEDEKGNDPKLFVVPIDEYRDLCALSPTACIPNLLDPTLDNCFAHYRRMFEEIAWFFESYKKPNFASCSSGMKVGVVSDKWSRVLSFLTRDVAANLCVNSVWAFNAANAANAISASHINADV